MTRRFLICRDNFNTQVDVRSEDELADEVYLHVWVHDRAEALAEMAWATGQTGDLHARVTVSEVL